MNFSISKNLKLFALFFIFASIPLAVFINQQVHNYQSSARERRDRDDSEDRAKAKTKTVLGFVYEDKNANMLKDSNEQGISGVIINVKTRLKKYDDDHEDREHLANSESAWSELQLSTDSLGTFRMDLPKNISVRSSRLKISVVPPIGFKLAAMNYRGKNDSEKKREGRVVMIGLIRDGDSIPEPSAPLPSDVPSSTPTPWPTISTIVEVTEAPSQVPASPTVRVCSPPPSCSGELITIDDPSLYCPIFFCYSNDPVI